MKKGWWITISVLLIVINIFLTLKLRNLNRSPIDEKIFVEGLNKTISIPSKESILTLIFYFSMSSCISCMEELHNLNRLYRDLNREEIFILGLTQEDIRVIKNKIDIAFPVIQDRDEKLKKRFNISIVPFKIIMDRRGKILYMSPSFSSKEFQESFYFEVLEILRKVRINESLINYYK